MTGTSLALIAALWSAAAAGQPGDDDAVRVASWQLNYDPTTRKYYWSFLLLRALAEAPPTSPAFVTARIPAGD